MKKFSRSCVHLLTIFFLALLCCFVFHWGMGYLVAKEIKPSNHRQEQLARHYYWQGEYLRAIDLWESLLKSSPETSPDLHRYLGVAYRQIGRFSRSVSHFQQALPFYQQQPHSLAEIFIEKARTLNELGQGERVIPLLKKAITLIDESEHWELQTTAYLELGTAYFLQSDLTQAIETYIHSRNLATMREQLPQQVTALNNLTNALIKRQAQYEFLAVEAEKQGNTTEQRRLLFLAQQDQIMAVQSAQKALNISQDWQNLSTVRAMINLTKLAPPDDHLNQAKQILLSLPPSRSQAFLLLTLAKLEPPQTAKILLKKAIELAANFEDFRTQSYALGQLGYVYEQQGKVAVALEYTEQAQWTAQQVMAADSLYRWQWQAGRLYQKANRLEQARMAYRGAIATLEKLREEIADASPQLQINVREDIEPVYRQFLELLLKGQPSPTQIREALQVTNQLQLTELQSFFGDPCLEIRQAQLYPKTPLAEGTAKIYSLLLPTSTQIILELPKGELHSYEVPFKPEQINELVQQWRFQLESSRIPLGYLDLSESLYDLLIRPLEKNLEDAQIKTLIFVNDGLLRNVPMLALHDKKQFLIEKYAISFSLGLNISFPQPKAINPQASIFGLSISVADFPPLPYVVKETQKVQQIFGGERFLDEEFTVSNLEKQMKKNNSLVHLATHGQFGGTLKTSFIQTFERPIFLEEVEQILSQRKDIIELLTLSACKTAVGNQRSVLGLAGVALRAGIKSVLASLWAVKDEETFSLISRFYQYWQGGISQEKAYQQALVELIAQPDSHPKNWSAFILIRNN